MTNKEIRKAIDKYQVEHPLQFGMMLDVTAISSKEGADIISQTIKRIGEKVNEDTELWCICEMAKMYMQGVKPVYPVRSQGEWIPVSERLPDLFEVVLVTDETGKVFEYERRPLDEEGNVCEIWTFLGRKIIAWMPLPEPYKEAENE